MRITKYVSKNDDNNAIWFNNPYHNRSFRVNDKLKQLMIQKSLRSFHDKKPQSTHDTKIPAKAGRFWSTKTPSNSWFKHPCQGRSFMVNKKPQATHDSNVLRSFHDKKPQATHDTNIPAKAGRFWSTKNLKQLMIQKSLRSSHDKKPQATHDSNIPAKAGRFWSTKYLKQLMIQKPLPRQVVSGQQKTSSNSWFKNPCQNRSFLVNEIPQTTHEASHDSHILDESLNWAPFKWSSRHTKKLTKMASEACYTQNLQNEESLRTNRACQQSPLKIGNASLDFILTKNILQSYTRRKRFHLKSHANSAPGPLSHATLLTPVWMKHK